MLGPDDVDESLQERPLRRLAGTTGFPLAMRGALHLH